MGRFTASGAIDEGDEHSMEIFLWSGETYRFEGECDADCRDVDLAVEGPGVSEADVLPDKVPVIVVTPPRSGIFTVTVHMFDCWVEPCFWTVTAERR
ncbi:MAG: hypothetical protein F4238_09265 [Gemmatimonadetes bacterium]|nr:hypothetical protein [Gemmatimonadota bacterium]